MIAARGQTRVAVVASTFGVGGAERVTADVLRRLDRNRFQTELFFLHDAGAVGRDLFQEGFGGCERLMKHRGDRRALIRLGVHLRAFRPHVVFCLDHHDAMTLGRLAGLAAGARSLIVASHATGLVGRRRAFGAVDRLLMEFTRRVVAVSPAHARYLAENEGIERDRIAVIENGVDLSAWPLGSTAAREAARLELGIAAGHAVVLMVAAMRPEKAHEALLGALVRLRREGRKVLALLAGDGERRAALESLADSMGIRADVVFLGVRRDVARLLHASDAVVLPSHAVVETLPLSVLEAMAAGTPVIASAVGSVPDIVRDGETGLLIPPADVVTLADRIGYILDDVARADRMRSRAHEWVAGRYSIDATTARYQELFEEVRAA